MSARHSLVVFSLVASSLALLSAPLKAEETGASLPGISWEAQADFSGIAESKFTGRSFRGDVSEIDFGARAVASKQIGSGPLLRVGVEWRRYEFGAPGKAPLPDTMQSIAAVIGADFQLGEAWLFRLEATPGFYSGGTDFRAGDFNVPVLFGGSYFVSADLQLVAGVELDVNRKYPVLGAVGVRWKFAPQLVLNLVLPTPRLEYTFDKDLTVYLGADLRETTYRMEGDFGRTSRRRALNDAIVDYTQIRVGAGATWSINPTFKLEVEAGVVVDHEFNYHRAEIGIRSQDYPAYGGISLKAAF